MRVIANSGISLDKEVYGLLKKGLDASSLRSKTSANNIANINTKGYKKLYVTFEDSLKNSMGNDELKLTDAKHIACGGESGEVELKQDTTTSMREDGNNVDIDNEMANQAANTLMYNALVSQVSNRLSISRYVINGK